MSEPSNVAANTSQNGTESASFNEITSDEEKIIIQEHPQSKSDDKPSECTPKPLDSGIIMEKILGELEFLSTQTQLILDQLREISGRMMRMEAAWPPTWSAGRPGPVQRFFDGI